MKLIIVSPFGMNKLAEALSIIGSWGAKGNVIRSKQVIVNAELARKHFDYLPPQQADRVSKEWSEAVVYSALVETTGLNDNELMQGGMFYISPDDRSDRETRLWFPEYFI